MKAERLLALYERIADAPNAVQRLRRFILDLAVRGKLVPQDPNDGSALAVMKGKHVPTCTRGPFDCPSSWVWVRAGNVAKTRLGKMLDKAKNKGIPRPYLRNVNVRWFDFDLSDLLEMPFEDGELTEFELRCGDVLICEGGEPGRAAVWDERTCGIYFQKAIHRVRLIEDVNPHFFVKALRASADDGRLAEYFTGTGIKHFTGKGLGTYLFPLPPLAEQRRIVAKVDELMALCDQLEKAREQREATRDRFAAATFARLNAPDPEMFREDAQFALGALAALTARSDQIKQLRQTILNLAVRGKLVEQDPNDEPVSELLKRIATEKRLLRRATVTVRSDTAPFPIPGSWKWAALDELITSGPQNGISPKPTTRADAPRAITLTATTSSVFNPNHFKRVEATIPSSSDLWLQQGDLLFQRGNTREYVGIAAIYEGPPTTFLFPDLMMRVRLSEHVNLRYVHLAAISPPARAFLSVNASGAQATMPKINQTTLVSLPLPIPPLAEQQRIVARVNELMSLCDQLEESLTKGDDTRRRLLDALLVEALAPVQGREMQAAE